MKKILLLILSILTAAILLAGATRGNIGNPIYYQTEKDTRVGGPYETTNSTSRFALTEAFVTNKTFYLTPDQARFAAPDVTEIDGKFLTIFTPGVSLVAVPLYILGQSFSMQQLFAYATVSLFALINFYLVYKLATKLGANTPAGLFSGFAFLFGTNALAYSQTFTQHHMGTTMILAGLLLATQKKSFLTYMLFGIVFGAGMLFDIPNLIFMAPVAFYLAFQAFKFSKADSKLSLSLKMSVFGLLVGLIPFVMLFGWYNKQTTGVATRSSQFLGRVEKFDAKLGIENTTTLDRSSKSNNRGSKLPFDTRLQMGGFYTLLASNERAWIFYSPIVLVGTVGLYYAYKKRATQTLTALATTTVLLNIILYSMFGDPWGGWTFGPRYLIPAAAILCGAIGVVLTRLKRNYVVLAAILILTIYSVYINVVGVTTTNAIPPKGEAENLENPLPYTYEYNFQMLEKNQSSALVYNKYFAESMTSYGYVYTYTAALLIFGLLLLAASQFGRKEKLS